jgi:D-alanyl-D-alanine-carboxypeptidase/D-alanyl-D-alanine-endopeptidase
MPSSPFHIPLLAPAVAAGCLLTMPIGTRAEDRLLEEAVSFTGGIAFLGSGAPGLVIAAVRNGETAFAGFGEIRRGSGVEPDEHTLMRIASISKAFCGDVMGSMIADGTIGVADLLADHLDDGWTVPTRDGHTLRLVDLVTQASGLPREVPNQTGGTPDDLLAAIHSILAGPSLARTTHTFSRREQVSSIQTGVLTCWVWHCRTQAANPMAIFCRNGCCRRAG